MGWVVLTNRKREIMGNQTQLHMIWPQNHPQPPIGPLPSGYRLRTYRDGDEAGYIALMQNAGFASWNPDNFQAVMRCSLPEGLFFVAHEPTGLLVATAVATHNPMPLHPFGGELGWVAVHPAHQGRSLGTITSAAATRRFLEAGYTDIYLRTDDFRLPAIKTYLKLGWLPFLFAPDMAARWQSVFEQLHIQPPPLAGGTATKTPSG